MTRSLRGNGMLALVLTLFSPYVASAGTIVVNDESGTIHDPGCGTSGTGQCTLVDAISYANANPGPDTIQFNMAGSGTRTINPDSLPSLTDEAGVMIDGFSQPGSAANTLVEGDNAIRLIRVSGGALIASGPGISLVSSHNVIQGLILDHWLDAIEIIGSSDNRVVGNLLGGSAPGTSINGNGVRLHGGAHANVIGGLVPADRNVISGNGVGILMSDVGTSSNVVKGNVVGLAPSGNTGWPNDRGIVLTNYASSNTIGGTTAGAGNVISRNGNGVVLLGPTSGNRIEGNRIGTTLDGMSPAGNSQYGVALLSGPRDNIVGGSVQGAGNLVSGNAGGISIEGTGAIGNRIEGNVIGTDLTGTKAIPNGWGIATSLFARGNIIGGSSELARNVISGNEMQGIILGVLSSQTVVLGNFVGTDRSGREPLGNGWGLGSLRGGILIHASSANRIGGLLAAEANVIAYNGNLVNGGYGVGIHPGDSDSADDSNAILSNSIHDNFGLSIDIFGVGGAAGVTANDAGDNDSGANQLQNFPVIQSISSSGNATTVRGVLNSAAHARFTIQLFTNPVCDETGHGEAESFLESAEVRTRQSGDAAFEVVVPVLVPHGRRIAATATDAQGNTSELSECFPRATSFHTVAPCRVVDTRDPAGPFGGPALSAGAARVFPVAGRCGIPNTAQAVSVNLTVTAPGASGHLTVFPSGARLPLASTLNYLTDQTRANNAIITLGTGGSLTVWCAQPSGGTAHAIIDVNGYFE